MAAPAAADGAHGAVAQCAMLARSVLISAPDAACWHTLGKTISCEKYPAVPNERVECLPLLMQRFSFVHGQVVATKSPAVHLRTLWSCGFPSPLFGPRGGRRVAMSRTSFVVSAHGGRDSDIVALKHGSQSASPA